MTISPSGGVYSGGKCVGLGPSPSSWLKESTSVGRSLPRHSRFSARMRRSETTASDSSRERRSAASCCLAAVRKTRAACAPRPTSTDRWTARFSAAAIRPIDGCPRSPPGIPYSRHQEKRRAPPDMRGLAVKLHVRLSSSRPSVPFRSRPIVARSGPNWRPRPLAPLALHPRRRRRLRLPRRPARCPGDEGLPGRGGGQREGRPRADREEASAPRAPRPADARDERPRRRRRRTSRW